jgi:hypothetical protein
MVGDDPQPCPQRRGGFPLRPLHRGVMLRERHNARPGMVKEPAVPGGPRRAVAAEDLAAGVEDDPGRLPGVRTVPADDGGGHGEGDVLRRAPSQLPLLGITEDIDPRTQLGGGCSSQQCGRRRPSAQLQRGEALRPQPGGGAVQRPVLVPHGRCGHARGVAVAGEGEGAGHLQARLRGGHGDAGGVLRRHAAAVVAAVHLHPHGDGPDIRTEVACQGGRALPGVDAHGDPRPSLRAGAAGPRVPGPPTAGTR